MSWDSANLMKPQP